MYRFISNLNSNLTPNIVISKIRKWIKMSEIKIKIEGMSCEHCKMAVEKALAKIKEIKSFTVDLEKGEAVISGNPVMQTVLDEINKVGYKATIVE